MIATGPMTGFTANAKHNNTDNKPESPSFQNLHQTLQELLTLLKNQSAPASGQPIQQQQQQQPPQQQQQVLQPVLLSGDFEANRIRLIERLQQQTDQLPKSSASYAQDSPLASQAFVNMGDQIKSMQNALGRPVYVSVVQQDAMPTHTSAPASQFAASSLQ